MDHDQAHDEPVITRKEFRLRFNKIAPDMFDRVLRDAEETLQDAHYGAISWDKILEKNTVEERIDKLLEYFEKEGWVKLYDSLNDAARIRIGNSFAAGER